MRNKIAPVIAAILLALPTTSFAADIERHRTKQLRGTLEQEIVSLTQNIDKAKDQRLITLNQSLELKRNEEKFITKIEDLQDDDHGNIKPRNAKLIDRNLNALESQLQHFQSHQ